jgi:hypothetical protein
MKVIFVSLLVCSIAISGFCQQTTLAQWTFPTGTGVDTLPDASSALNTAKAIRTIGGVSSIDFKNGATTKAAQATKWDSGMDAKAWKVEINTTGFGQIKLSSKLTAGGSNPGPRDLKLQYKAGNGEWTDVPNGAITVGNDWTTGVLNALALPAECENQESVGIRWIMTSNLDINGNTLVAAGISKIDDIVITGQTISGISAEELDNSVAVYPNPCSERMIVTASKRISSAEIYSITGSRVLRLMTNQSTLNIPVGDLLPGRYFLIINYEDHTTPGRKSVIIK